MDEIERNIVDKRQALAACFQILPYCINRINHDFQLMLIIKGLTNFFTIGKAVAISVVEKIHFIIDCKTTERNQVYTIR